MVARTPGFFLDPRAADRLTSFLEAPFLVARFTRAELRMTCSTILAGIQRMAVIRLSCLVVGLVVVSGASAQGNDGTDFYLRLTFFINLE